MRMSVRDTDPDFDPLAYDYMPYLDGEPILNCHTADEEKGTIEVWKQNIDGTYCIENGALVSETLTGKVEIRRVKHA